MPLPLLLLALAASPPVPKVSCPASAMGSLGCEAVAALNRPGPALTRWLAGVASPQMPAADRADLEKTLQTAAQSSGGVDLVAARDGRSKGVAVLTVQARRRPAQMQLVLFPDPAQPTKLGRLDTVPLGLVTPEEEWPKQHLADAKLSELVRARLGKLVADRDFSGCVSVYSGKMQVIETCAGLADRTFDTKVSRATRFRLGSMDKMFTALAIAQLVEAHKLSYDSTLAQVIPNAPLPVGARQATVWQLLHHQAGLGDFFVPEFFEHRERFVQPADYLDLIARQPMAAAPGERFAYSNAGFVLLGRIVELVSGESYFDYVQRHVFAPAGMGATGFDAIDEITPNLAIGYLHDDPFAIGPWKANWATLPFKGSPAGGGYSTAGDLILFARALHGGKLLAPAGVARLFEGAVPVGPDTFYAAGFEDRVASGQHLRGHSGGAPGMNAALQIVWGSGAAVAVVSNEDGPAAQILADHIADALAAP